MVDENIGHVVPVGITPSNFVIIKPLCFVGAFKGFPDNPVK